MFSFTRKKEKRFLYLTPVEDDLAKWEVFDQEELEKRVEKNLLKEGSKLFKVEQEIAIRFEKITHLD